MKQLGRSAWARSRPRGWDCRGDGRRDWRGLTCAALPLASRLQAISRIRPGRPPLWPSAPAVQCDTPPADAGPGWRDERLARLEAALFLAREPLAGRRLAELAGLRDGREVRSMVGRLNAMYDDSASAFRVEEIAGGFQLLTRRAFGPWLRRLHGVPLETRLSGPALETLAVVAYRQPVLRAEVEAIRGVQCGEMLRQLMERDLVRIVGRSEELGRPFLYGTTHRFLQIFGLRHLDELPRAGVLRSPGEAPSRPDESETVSGQESLNCDVSGAATQNACGPQGQISEESEVSVTIQPESAHEEEMLDDRQRLLVDEDVVAEDVDEEEDDYEYEDDEEEDDWDYDEEDEDEEEEWDDEEDDLDEEEDEWEEVGDEEEDEEEFDDDEWDDEEEWDDDEWDEEEDYDEEEEEDF